MAQRPLAPPRTSAYPSSVRLGSSLPLVPLLLLANACGIGGDGDAGSTNEPTATTTHALLKVERSVRVGAEDDVSARAFAGVVRVPEMADPEPLLRLYGGGLTLPSAGQCTAVSRERDSVVAPELTRAEFLNAGEVSLRASDVETLLAPRAFPASVTEIPGVVYTSRDSASDPLPGGASYSLKATGSDQLLGLEVQVQAPELLSEVTVGGAPLGNLSWLPAAADLSVSWRPGDARDLVYVEVGGSSELGTLGVCAFRDSEGRGTLPGGLFGVSGAGSLSFHRLREVAADAKALDAAEVRFDFELMTEVSFR
jgi:hypothetical protein